MTNEQAAAKVGFHNYYRAGVFDAVHQVQADCPAGWRAGAAGWHQDIPEDAVKVGQVRVRSGDPVFTLYIRRV